MKTDVFALRHIGPNSTEREEMLRVIGVNSMEELIEKTVPSNIQLSEKLQLPRALSEYEYYDHILSKGRNF